MKSLIHIAITLGMGIFGMAGCATTHAPSTDEPPVLIYQTVAADAHPVFRQYAETSATDRRKGFTFTSDANDRSLADFRLELDFRTSEGNFAVMEAAWAETTTMLLTMYPATCGRYILELNAELYDRNGENVGSWNLVEQDTAFLWLFHGRDCGRTQSDKTIRKYSARMVDDLYAMIWQELRRPDSTGAPNADSGRVFIETRNISPALQRIVRSESRGRNITFDPDGAAMADHTVSISMSSTKPEQGIANLAGRSMGTMMTLGLISVCPPNEMILTAKISDPDDETVREYRFSQRVRASGLNDCERPTVASRPKHATRLVRKLIGEMKKDGFVTDQD